MSQPARVFIWTVLVTGGVTGCLALAGPAPAPSEWLAFAVLVVLATIAQLFEAPAPGRQSYYPALVFFFAGVLLLPPPLLVALIVVPHLGEEITGRMEGRRRLWYIQPFNVATHLLSALAAAGVHRLFDADIALYTTPLAVIVGTLSALVYVTVNHLLVGLALVLARGIPWRESGVLAPANLLTDLVLLLLGLTVAILWWVNPWLIAPALSPLVLMHRALLVPQLQQEAYTDVKTGLLNARQFRTLVTTELERAARFERPLALIVGDLDLLRNINNTYGHLAGDAVLSGVGAIIRERVREYDIAARFGGEEFVIALPETDLASAQVVAEDLRRVIAAARFSVTTSHEPIGATMSLGIAAFPADATTLDALIHAADVAVYRAKVQGRNQVMRATDVPAGVGGALADSPDGPPLPPPAPVPLSVPADLPAARWWWRRRRSATTWRRPA